MAGDSVKRVCNSLVHKIFLFDEFTYSNLYGMFCNRDPNDRLSLVELLALPFVNNYHVDPACSMIVSPEVAPEGSIVIDGAQQQQQHIEEEAQSMEVDE